MSRRNRSEWKSPYPFDRGAKRIVVDGVEGSYVAFVRYRALPCGLSAGCNANVINLRPDLRDWTGDDRNRVLSVLEHEKQHVAQFFEIPDHTDGYWADPLPWEKEACARQILKGPVVTTTIVLEIVETLVSNGMGIDEALAWVDSVERAGD